MQRIRTSSRGGVLKGMISVVFLLFLYTKTVMAGLDWKKHVPECVVLMKTTKITHRTVGKKPEQQRG